MPTICIEGPDGVGKSTVVDAIGEWCKITGREHVIVHNPGSTGIGKLLRKLIKDPTSFGAGIVITPLVERLLMLCDNAAFVDEIHVPNSHKWIIMDRSNFISDIAYGQAGGIDIDRMKKLHSLILNPPKIDELFILRCPFEVTLRRRMDRSNSEKCRIEESGDDFFRKVGSIYESLLKDHGEYLRNFVRTSNGQLCAEYVDATMRPGMIVSSIVTSIVTSIAS